jgi:hypothetical protein
MPMTGLLTDVNIQGQVEILRYLLESTTWRELWHSLAAPIHTFGDVGLRDDDSDAVVWRFCQQRQLVLITANRNQDGPDSLETTIRNENTPDSLPVFTLADSEQVRHSKAYAERVVESLLQYLLDIELYRGTGRLYLP